MSEINFAAIEQALETRDMLIVWSDDPKEERDATGMILRALRIARAAEQMEKALEEAISDIVDWGAYADEYFQEKHDLAGRIEGRKLALAAFRAAKVEPAAAEVTTAPVTPVAAPVVPPVPPVAPAGIPGVVGVCVMRMPRSFSARACWMAGKRGSFSGIIFPITDIIEV